MTLATLIVNVQANTAQLVREVDKTNQTLGRLESAAGLAAKTIAGAFTATAILGAIKAVGDWAGQIDDVSKRLGISAEAVQRLSFAADQNGASIALVTTAITEMGRRLVEGEDSTVGAVRALGLSMEALRASSPDQAFITLARAIAEVPDPMQRSALAFDLFGRSGTQLLPMMQNLSEDMARATVASDGMVKMGDQLGDAFDSLLTIGKVLLAAVIVPLAPLLSGLATAASAVVNAFGVMASARGGPMLAGQVLKGIGEAAEIAEKRLQAMREALFIQPIKMGEKEQRRIEQELADDLKRRQAHEHAVTQAAQRAADQQAQAYRQYRNMVGEMEIQAEVDRLARLDREAAAQREYLNMIGEMEIAAVAASNAAKEAADREYREFRNEIGLRMMEDDARQMQQSASMWKEHLEALGEAFVQLAQIGGSSVGAITRSIGTAIGAVGVAMTATKSLTGGFRDLGSGNILKGLTGITSGIGGIVAAATAAVEVVKALWHGLQRLFGGGEEGVVVNPARDTFLSQFGGPGTGPGSGFMNLAEMLTSITGEHGGGALHAALRAADTMDAFRSAAQAIVDLLTSHGIQASMNFHTGGVVPGSGEVSTRLLGGEGVLSREGMRAFDRMNRGQAPGNRGVVAAIDRLGARIEVKYQQLADLIPMAARDQIMLARGRMA